jgi:hypothetical protein
MTMPWTYDDGGREIAKSNCQFDCVTRACAIAMELPYQYITERLSAIAQRPFDDDFCRAPQMRGSLRNIYEKFLTTHGWEWVPFETQIQTNELPKGRLIVRCYGTTLLAVVDGVLHDTYDSSRQGRRVIHGYFHNGSITEKRAVIIDEL